MSLILSRALAETAEQTVQEVQAEPSWFQTAFKKLAELPVWGWIIVLVLFLGAVFILSSTRHKKQKWTTQMLCVGAMCIALSTVLSRIRLFTMPSGGSITPASMLPLMLFAYVYGTAPGLLLGAVFGLLDYAFGGWFLNVPQFLLDYPIAFGMLGLAGLTRGMRNDRVGFPLGTFVGSAGRYLAAVLAGVAFWSDGRTGLEAWLYSLGYNGTYMSVECILCVVIAVLIGSRILQAMRKVR